MITPRRLLACLLVFAAQACASGGPSQPMDPPDPPAVVVEVVATRVTAAGIRFEDAVVTLLNESVVELQPSHPGGRIRVGGFGAVFPRDARSAGARDPEEEECLASCARIRWLSASTVEVELQDVDMQDESGRRVQMDKLRISIEQDGIKTMDAEAIERSGSGIE